MSKVLEPRTSFNGGELSPLIAGRIDVAKFSNGCARMENFLPTTQGPAMARPGFRHVAEVKASANRSWLIRFERSVEAAFMLEFGDQYIRFYTNRAQLQVSSVSAWVTATAYVVGDLRSNGGTNYYCEVAHTSGVFATDLASGYWHALTGTIYEIPSPYTAAELTNSDGTLALRYAQTGDVVYLVHPSHPPYKLSRLGTTNWTLAAVDFAPPPFAALNSTATTIYASAATGSVTLTASASVFTSGMVGQYVYLGEKDVRSTLQWEAGKARTAGDVRRSDGKNYEALNTATTGGVRPTHSEGAVYDGDTGVQWQFLDPGYGWAKITAYGSGTSVTATVVSRIPANAVGAGNPTTRWAFQAWTSTDGYPNSVTFFRERLTFARDSLVWFSVTGDFENFSYEIDGEITADAAFDREIASDRTNAIRWLSPGNVLLVGTLGDEWAISEQTTTDAFGPSNAQTRRQSTYGSGYVAPVRIGGDTMFVQKAGRKVRAMAFRFEEDGFESPDVTVFAEHITKPGIVDMGFQQEPWSVLWACRSDGVLIGLTFNREQDVVGWHRHPMTGATVETVETMPSPDGTRDDLWIIGRYTINGATKRYVAFLEQEADELTDQEDWFYVDQGATYSGAAATVISGLGYLEGEEVWVLADGAVHPNRTVSAGSITLQSEATKVHVGLPSPALIETTELDPQRVGYMKRISRLVIRLWLSMGGKAGPSEAKLSEMQFRSPSTPMGSAPPSFTGDVEIEYEGDYFRKQTVIVSKDKPAPLTIAGLFPPQSG